ncbi:RHS repeat-associated core domain-containing protein [Lachnotalea glycerini]|uniref:RHS repeat-associated core domain-containing protein n=2 Tax=Lachnotalea glycerini TaxID=1763509 RepID=A0A371J1M5_9FIRM|nr:RHS repeat-associated core domain-containing protein [Lachnotalea glycerini]
MGSITHVTEQDEVLNRYEYDAWGNVTESEERVENRFQFNGQQLDPISQQYYLRARYYNPVIGRFTQEDTYRGDGLNLYAYCANNPVSYVDPSGNQCKAAKDRLAASTSKGKNETKTATKLTEHQDSSSKGAGQNIKGNKNLDVGTSDGNKKSKTYQTYTKTNPETGEIYSGRTSGTGSPAENVRRRDANHHMNDKGFGPAQLDKTSKNYKAIRGREQLLIDKHGGAQSTGGKSGNSINGIGKNNKKKTIYLNAAKGEFGEIE